MVLLKLLTNHMILKNKKTNKMNLRIVERTYPSGNISYVIQKKHWLFKDKWVDCEINRAFFYETAKYKTLEEAKKNLYLFSKTKIIDKVVYP